MSRGYAWYVLGVMVAINFLNYLDRFVLPAAASAIQDEFHINDSQIGALASAFLLVYSLTVLPFGFWADRGVRKTVIGVGVTVWSLATLLTGFAQSFWQLFATRALLGVGEAGYFPAGTSLMGDWFPKDMRARASALWNAGSVFGIAVGFIGGGIVAQAFGWRWAFYGTAVPGLICAFLAFTMREPRRGAAEATGPRQRRDADATLSTFVGLLRIRSYRSVVIAQVMLYAVLAALATWLPIFVHRQFGLGVGASATYAGGVLIVGGLVGTLAGGWLGDRLAARNPAAHLQIAVLSFVAGAVLLAIALRAPSLTLFVLLALPTSIALYLYVAPFTALQQNVVAPTLRAGAVTLGLFIGHLLGDSWSSYIAGVLSDNLGGLPNALTILGPPMLLLAAAAAATGLRSVRDDVRAMETDWAARPAVAEIAARA